MERIKYMAAFVTYVTDPRQLKLLILLIQLFALSLLIGCRSQLSYDLARYEAELDNVKAYYDAEIQQLTANAEAGIYATQYMPQAHMGEAWTLAQWLDCLDAIYPGITTEAKSLACWVVINRMESGEYPDDLESVLLQPGQFCEFSNEKPPTEVNVTIASNQLSRYYNGDIRPASAQAVYITISRDGVVLRDKWDEAEKCNKWRA